MGIVVLSDNNTVINNDLELIVRSKLFVFNGYWHLDEAVLGWWQGGASLPVTYDYLININDSNNVICPEDLEIFLSILDATPERTFLDFNIRIINSNGEIKALHGVGRFIDAHQARSISNDDTGEITPPLDKKTIPATSDVKHEDRGEAALELKAANELLESIIQSDIVALSVFKGVMSAKGEIEDFEWVMANRLLKAIAGGQNVVGKRYTDVFPRAARSGGLEMLRKVMVSGERTVDEFYHQDSNVKGWFRAVYARVRDMVIVSAEDITFNKKAEQDLKESKARLLKNVQVLQQAEMVAGIGSWEFIITENQFSWSEGMYRIFGVENTTSVQPETYLHFAVKEDLPVAERIVKHFRHNPMPFEEVIRVKVEGRVRTLKVKATVMNDDHGRPWKLLGVDFDITAVTESERLKELNNKLKEVDRAKTKFFNNVSHEFRTPLTLLLGPLEDIMKNSGSSMLPGDIHKLEMAQRNGLRLQKLVNNLLDFSRMEAGKMDVFYQPADLSKFTAELASSFRSAIEKAGLKLVVKTLEASEPVYVNREMWEKIVLNLLSNAFKFTHKGKITVTVRMKRKYIAVHVRDTGVGISADNLPKILREVYTH